jgi:hypothetical protein
VIAQKPLKHRGKEEAKEILLIPKGARDLYRNDTLQEYDKFSKLIQFPSFSFSQRQGSLPFDKLRVGIEKSCVSLIPIVPAGHNQFIEL